MRNIQRSLLVSFALFAVLLVGRAIGEGTTHSEPSLTRPRLGVFSWQRTNASDETAAKDLFDLLVSVGASEVYQNLDVKGAGSFLRRAKELQIDVYMLSGKPEWGLDRNARQMINEVDKTAKLITQMNGEGPAGLMLDVEPYLTGAYLRNPKQTLAKYLAAMRKTYAHAQEKGVTLILCIPYFYDSVGFTEELNTLIREACDGAAVMNYQRADEIGQIEAEVAASRQAGKRLIHIYELQRPGLYELTESSTYYTDGLPAIWESQEKLQAHFAYEGLSFALHELGSLHEVNSR
ncbi:MAG: hypothetical protein AB9880_08940 [Christensenellales bacterium]